jgi:hypothetical protein
VAEILRIGAAVATPLGLLGFIAALSYYFYARRLKSEEKKLEALPAEDRARATDERLSRYGIDAANLTREDKNHLILQEMEKRYRFAQLCVVVFTVAFVLCFALATAAFVIAMNQSPKEFQELKKELEKRQAGDERVLAILATLATRQSTPEEVEKLKQELKEEKERRKASEEQFAAKLQDLAIRRPTPEVEGLIGRMQRLDHDIERQQEAVESADPTSIDVELMKLKRMIDKREQQFDMLRQIIDKYNQTAKGIIDSMGR